MLGISVAKLKEITSIVESVGGEGVDILDDSDSYIVKVPTNIRGISGHFVVVIEK